MSEETKDTTVSVDETTLSEEKGKILIPKERFDEVSTKYKEAKAELEKFRLSQKELEEKQALEQGKFKELFELKEKELNEFKNSYKQEKLNNTLLSELSKYNPNDIDVLMKVIEKEKFVNEAGEVDVTAIAQEIASLTETKPFLFNSKQVVMGNSRGGNPEQPNSPVFRESQLRDSDFVAKNLEAITQASKEGRILIGE